MWEYLFVYLLMSVGFILGYITRGLWIKPIEEPPVHEHCKDFKKHQNKGVKWTIK